MVKPLRLLAVVALVVAGCDDNPPTDKKPEPAKTAQAQHPASSMVDEARPTAKKFAEMLKLPGEPSCYESKDTVHCTLAEIKSANRVIHEFDCNKDGCLYLSSKEY